MSIQISPEILILLVIAVGSALGLGYLLGKK